MVNGQCLGLWKYGQQLAPSRTGTAFPVTTIHRFRGRQSVHRDTVVKLFRQCNVERYESNFQPATGDGKLAEFGMRPQRHGYGESA